MIRDAAADDAAAVSAVAARAWPAAYRGLFDPAFIDRVLEHTYAARSVARHIAECAGHFLVAEEGGKVVGFLHYEPGELHRLYLDPGRIGSGLGRALVEELNRRLEPGTEYVALVRAGNDRAEGFYEHLGFELAERVDGFERFAAGHGVSPGAARDAGAEGPLDLLMRFRVPVRS